MDVGMITVAYNSAGVPGGVAAGARVLRETGLATLATSATSPPGDVALADDGEVPLGVPEPRRGRSGLLAEDALVEMVHAVQARTHRVLAAGRLPLVIGGDCPVLLGGLVACRDKYQGVGLLFVDGHEDAWPPNRSPTGEAADCELGIALGRGLDAVPPGLRSLMPVLDTPSTVALGPRDEAELADSDVASLESEITLIRPDAIHRAHDAGNLAEVVVGQIDRLRARQAWWWLHTDLDVLATEQLAAVDYPQPGGLTWRELEIITQTALTNPGCAGWTVTIYNPDLDPGHATARRIVRFVHDCLAARADGRGHE